VGYGHHKELPSRFSGGTSPEGAAPKGAHQHYHCDYPALPRWA